MVEELRSKLPEEVRRHKPVEGAEAAPSASSVPCTLPEKTDTALFDAWIYRVRCKTLTALPPQLTLPLRQGSLRAAAEALLAKHSIKGTVLCALPSGSRLHGLASTPLACLRAPH